MFTEDMAGCGWQGASAIDAWRRNADKHQVLPQVGFAVYFDQAAGNEYYGHTGIVTGPDEFVSVTYNGVRRYAISWWNANEAPLLGYIKYWRD